MSRLGTYRFAAAELAAIVDTASAALLREDGWTDGHGAAEFEVGDIVYAYVRGASRRGKVAKTGRTNLTVECTTVGAINEANRHGRGEPCVTAKVVKAADVYRAKLDAVAIADEVEAAIERGAVKVTDAAAPADATVVDTAPEVAAVETPAATMNREEWLTRAVDALRPIFAERALAELPATVAVSVGWPASKSPRKVIGQCWPTATGDGVPHLYISPTLADPAEVLGVLVHELVHAWDDCKSGHKGMFAKCARALGLVGKMTATTVGDELAEVLQVVADTIGPYPHTRVTLTDEGVKKQTTRMLKVECPGCGYVVRTTAKWLELGTPTCVCGEVMEGAA